METVLNKFRESIEELADYETMCSLAMWFAVSACKEFGIPTEQKPDLEIMLLEVVEERMQNAEV